MKITESFRISWRAITGHKLRSSLTTLGIIIGVGAVIVFMVLGGAFEANIAQDIREGNDEPGMWVNTQQQAGGFGGTQFVDAAIYTESDVAALESIDGVEYVAPEASLPVAQLNHGDQQRTGGFAIEATTGDRLEEDITTGESFSADDELVLSAEATDLVEGELGVGDEVELSYEDGTSKTFTIVGLVDDTSSGGNNLIPTAGYVSLDNYQTTVATPDGGQERAERTHTSAYGGQRKKWSGSAKSPCRPSPPTCRRSPPDRRRPPGVRPGRGRSSARRVSTPRETRCFQA